MVFDPELLPYYIYRVEYGSCHLLLGPSPRLLSPLMISSVDVVTHPLTVSYRFDF